MNRHSLLVKITIFFVFLFIAINALLVSYYFFIKDKFISLQGQRYIKILKVIKSSPFITTKEIIEKTKEVDVKLIEDKSLLKEIKEKGKTLFDDKFISIYSYNDIRYIKVEKFIPNKIMLEFKNSKEYQFFKKSKELNERKAFNNYLKDKNIKPIFTKPKTKELLFEDISTQVYLIEKQRIYAYSFTFLIDLFLILFYIFLYKKIKPLHELKKKITKFANGDLELSTKIKGKDEIALVANEFNNAIIKIKELTQSRNLFLRNIMHEFKTPITKGKIITDTLEEGKRQEILKKAFYRLEQLLKELGKVEELTSGEINLKKKEFRIVDILDQSIDMLLITKKDILIHDIDTNIYVDFELFSIAIKNLIDNALRYSTNNTPEIFVKNNKIIFKNKGIKLKKDITQYCKAFNHEYETSDDSLGLGLYITNNIIKIHGFKLKYKYENSYHYFSIVFS